MGHMQKQEKISQLYELLAGISTPGDCRDLMEDLCTTKEIEKMAERVYAAKLLMKGKTYSQIIDEADISTATLSRVSRCVQYGKGYSRFLRQDTTEKSKE